MMQRLQTWYASKTTQLFIIINTENVVKIPININVEVIERISIQYFIYSLFLTKEFSDIVNLAILSNFDKIDIQNRVEVPN
jgi:hypothetical protein